MNMPSLEQQRNSPEVLLELEVASRGESRCSSSSPEDSSTTLRFLLGCSSLTRSACLVSWRCFERLSNISSLIGVYSTSRSDVGDPLCQGGDLTLLNLDPLLLGMLSCGWCQGTYASPRTCKDHRPTTSRSAT